MPITSRAAAAALLPLVTTFALAGCSGGGEGSAEEKSPEEVMELAKKTLDETPGLDLSLSTDQLPKGVTGLVNAEGLGTHQPAFDGTVTVIFAGQNVQVPVIAVDDKVYAQIPLTPGWSDIDPAEYGAPDPAKLMATEGGLSDLLPATEGLEEGESVRGGEGNKEVLTEYTGSVPGAAVKSVLPSAGGDQFDAVYTITEDGELRSAELTGVFYPNSPEMTYTVDFDNYGQDEEITKP